MTCRTMDIVVLFGHWENWKEEYSEPKSFPFGYQVGTTKGTQFIEHFSFPSYRLCTKEEKEENHDEKMGKIGL